MSTATIDFPATRQDNIKRVFSNNRHSNKISWKRKEAFKLANDIKEYVKQFDISLPAYYKEFRAKRKEIMQYDSYEDAMDKDLGELVKLHYDLKTCNKGIYAVFNDTQKIATQLLACWYSKNRLDPVWNYRKSKLIRKVWYEFLKESKINQKYTPVHLVLTVPHKDGIWKDKKFYARELINAYNLLRRDKQFKKFIYGGEYGLECKASKDKNGLHIHVHSLLFQRTKYSLKEVRTWITGRWKEITGNTSGYSGIHFEQLYCYKRDASGAYINEDKEFITGTTEVQDADGDFSFEAVTEQKQLRKKFRVGTKSSLEDYLSGVMECIKYHFKPGCLEKEDGSFDLELIKDILNNTKGLRMYSRFGELYKEKKLDFSRYEKPTDKQNKEELEEEVMASLSGVIEGLINPLTYAPAAMTDFRLAISCPEFLSHRPKDFHTPCEPIINCMDSFYFIDADISLKEAMALLAKGQYRKMLDYDSFQRFRTFVQME